MSYGVRGTKVGVAPVVWVGGTKAGRRWWDGWREPPELKGGCTAQLGRAGAVKRGTVLHEQVQQQRPPCAGSQSLQACTQFRLA